jgi:hypothetical protein
MMRMKVYAKTNLPHPHPHSCSPLLNFILCFRLFCFQHFYLSTCLLSTQLGLTRLEPTSSAIPADVLSQLGYKDQLNLHLASVCIIQWWPDRGGVGGATPPQSSKISFFLLNKIRKFSYTSPKNRKFRLLTKKMSLHPSPQSSKIFFAQQNWEIFLHPPKKSVNFRFLAKKLSLHPPNLVDSGHHCPH